MRRRAEEAPGQQARCVRRADQAPGRAAESPAILAILAIGASRRTAGAALASLTRPAQAHASSAAALTSSLKSRLLR